MDQPIVRLIGFVVLVAIVLATGFGAIGAPLVALRRLLMAAQRFGGKYSPDAKPTVRRAGAAAGAAVPQPHARAGSACGRG